MEKKTSRLAQPGAKGLASDSKKTQDGAGGKVWPRGGRRREAAGSSLAAKSEPSRKPNPQRNKTFDKRPRARGTVNDGAALARTETARLEDEFAPELCSVFVPGSKKQSLNHLLNFNYTPYVPEGRHQQGRGPKGGSRLNNTRKHKYNKEHFLQANCQFIVNASGDYKQYMNNPDALVDWSLIEQVKVQVSEGLSCPICLYPPVAAKMTRCGHIYCWPCMLHYLALSDDTARKCPICFDYVHKKDLKSVASKTQQFFKVGEQITFKLMKRPRGSLIAYPATSPVKEGDLIFNLSEKDADDVYAKLLLADKVEILEIIEKEYETLQKRLLEDGPCPEDCFIAEAMSLLDERKSKVDCNEIVIRKESLEGALDKVEINDGNTCSDEFSTETADISNNTSKFHYFYQASDGQHIYLHAINARMLEHTYGSLEFGPKSLTGTILEKEGGSMDEDLRKRLRYLQHLPLTCQFEVAEIRLKEPLVTKDTLQYFKEQIDVRRRRRERRDKEEKRREKRIEDEENRKMGKYPVPNLHIESQAQFPGFEPRPRSESECTLPSEGSTSDLLSPLGSLTTEHDHAGPSFAKMLASAKKEVPSWPSLKSSVDASALVSVTGSKMKSGSFNRRNFSDSEAEFDFEPVLPCSTNLADHIEKAMQEKGSELESSARGKKKKKKNKPKILLLNSMPYSGK